MATIRNIKLKKTVEIEEEIEIPAIVAGGIYRFTNRDGSTEEAMCIATKESAGKRRGLFRSFSQADTWLEEGDEAMYRWQLVRAPEAILGKTNSILGNNPPPSNTAPKKRGRGRPRKNATE